MGIQGKHPNTFVAREISTGQRHYLVGYWNADAGVYQRPPEHGELIGYPTGTMFLEGTFAELARFTHRAFTAPYTSAAMTAKRKMGYCRLARAVEALGKGYEALEEGENLA